MWPEFLVQDLQEVALRKVHLKNGVELVVPRVRFGADGHRQRDEVLWHHVWNVSHHALEVADLFKNANVATEDVDIQLQAPPRSRRSSSRVPEAPTSVKVISRPSTASTARSLRAHRKLNYFRLHNWCAYVALCASALHPLILLANPNPKFTAADLLYPAQSGPFPRQTTRKHIRRGCTLSDRPRRHHRLFQSSTRSQALEGFSFLHLLRSSRALFP